MRLARSLADASAGKSIAAKMAMMAMTTSSSIRVKPRDEVLVGAFIVSGKKLFCGRLQNRQEVVVQVLNIARSSTGGNQCKSCPVRFAESHGTIRHGHFPALGFVVGKVSGVHHLAVNVVHDKHPAAFEFAGLLKNSEAVGIHDRIVGVTTAEAN